MERGATVCMLWVCGDAHLSCTAGLLASSPLPPPHSPQPLLGGGGGSIANGGSVGVASSPPAALVAPLICQVLWGWTQELVHNSMGPVVQNTMPHWPTQSGMAHVI